MRRMAVCESLLAAPFLEALKGGDDGVHDQAILVDPRVMGHPGRPAQTLGPNDPGELSGIVWFVESTLDTDLRRKQHEEGRKARLEYQKLRRGNKTTVETIHNVTPYIPSSGKYMLLIYNFQLTPGCFKICSGIYSPKTA